MEYTVETKLLSEKSVNSIPDKDTVSFFYDTNGDYLISLKSNRNLFTLYKSKENLIYSFDSNVDYVLAVDAGVDLEEKLLGTLPIIQLIDSTLLFNDKICNSVLITWKSGEFEYFYTPELLFINPDIYRKHIYDQWYNYLKISKALPIRIVKRIKGLSEITFDLINYSSSSIDRGIFALPRLKEVKCLENLFPHKKVFKYR